MLFDTKFQSFVILSSLENWKFLLQPRKDPDICILSNFTFLCNPRYCLQSLYESKMWFLDLVAGWLHWCKPPQLQELPVCQMEILVCCIKGLRSPETENSSLFLNWLRLVNVCSLTRFFSCSFSQSRIIVQECFFYQTLNQGLHQPFYAVIRTYPGHLKVSLDLRDS